MTPIFVWIYRATRLYPRLVAITAATLTAGALFLASRLKFEGDVTLLLPPKDVALYKEILESRGGIAELIILLEGEDPKALREAAERYKALHTPKYPNTKRVWYEPPKPTLTNDFAPLLSREEMTRKMSSALYKMQRGAMGDAARHDPLGVKEKLYTSARNRFKGYRFDLSDGALYSEDRKALLVIVDGNAKPHDVEAARETYEAAKKIPVPAGVTVSMTGGYVVRVETEKQVQKDLIGTSALSLVGVLLIFILGFREWKSILIALVPVVVGLLLTLGFTQLAYGHISGLSVVFAAMVVGLGIDFPIQFYNRWRAEGHVGKTLPGLGPPMFFAAVTTTAVMWALVPSSMPAYRELGVIAGAGIFFTLAATLFLCPLLIPPRRPPIESRFPIGRLGAVLLPLFVIVTIALGLFAKRGLNYENDYLKLAGAAEYYKTQEKIGEKFGGTLDAMFFVSRTQKEAEEIEPKLQKLVDAGILSGFLPAERPLQIEAQRFRDDFHEAVRLAVEAEWPKYKDNPEKIQRLFEEYENWIVDHLKSERETLLVSTGMLRERLWLRDKRRATLSAIRETGLEFTGSTVLTDALEEAYRRDVKRATLFGAVAVLLLVVIHLRHPVRVLLAFIPVILGLLWTLGLMNLMDIRLNPLSATVFLLVTGIGIDNGIHLVARSREIGPDPAASELLRPMILTSGTTILSFGTLMFAGNGMIRTMGQVLTIGVTASLVAAVLVLPAILRMFRPR